MTYKRKSDIPFGTGEVIMEPGEFDQAVRETAIAEGFAFANDKLFRPGVELPDKRTARWLVEVGDPDLAETNIGLRDLQKECWQIAEDHGFHDVGQTFGDKLMLLVTEAAEAMEAFRDGKDLDEVWYEKDGTKPCGIPSELADIFIRLVDTAEDGGVDLASAVIEKMEYNRTREYLHGKKL